MKNRLNALLVIILFILMGCSKDGTTGEKPPKSKIKIGKESYETSLGTYCWKGTCVDAIGSVERLKGKVPVKVKPNEEIRFVIDYEPKPNDFHLTQTNEGKEKEVTVRDNRFVVPTEEGIYYYDYGVWWMDEKEEHLSHGDASYAFVLEVK
ncbi:hypothetical protein [Peribacillus cavernae]|uniref:hypothetical protein n=1 Tax=Peribacillus cavernae TaxID=1674310 RepID=UPI001FE2AB47|nr:hypothetical protein [Peribacillus cavernae]MDQ0220429.1 hypothetical protein [Peribacillus cavernae]